MTGLIIVALICGAINCGIGARKGRPWLGLVLGLLLGVIGIIIMLFIKPTQEYLVSQEQHRLAARQEAERRIGGGQ